MEADIIIYVSFFNNPFNKFIAFGTVCVFDTNSNFRPIVGGILINLALINENPIYFQKYVNLIIHE